MKTLYVLSNASGYGGAERNLELLLQALSPLYRIVVFVENERHKHAVEMAGIAGLRIVRFRKGKGLVATALNLLTLRRWVKSDSSTTILANSNKGAFYLALYRLVFRALEARVLLFIHDFQWKYLPFIRSQLTSAEFL